jgi:hypothetical protein
MQRRSGQNAGSGGSARIIIIVSPQPPHTHKVRSEEKMREKVCEERARAPRNGKNGNYTHQR